VSNTITIVSKINKVMTLSSVSKINKVMTLVSKIEIG